MGRGREALPALLTAGFTNDEDNKRKSMTRTGRGNKTTDEKTSNPP